MNYARSRGLLAALGYARTMQIGVTFPQTRFDGDPVAVRDFAQAADALGYSHMLVYDHVLGAVHEGREPELWGPYTDLDPFH